MEILFGTVKTVRFEMDYARIGNGKKDFVIIPGLSVKKITPGAQAVGGRYSAFLKDYTLWVFDRINNAPEGYSIPEMAEDTAAAMNELNIKKADIIGSSQGGMIAMYIAVNHPWLVSSLILASTVPKCNKEAKNIFYEWISLAEQKDEKALNEAFMDKIYSPETVEEYRDAIIFANSSITDKEYESFIIMTSAIPDIDCTDRLCEIQCPTLITAAKGDKIFDYRISEKAAEIIGCELYLYDENNSHAVYDEDPEFPEKIFGFLNSDYYKRRQKL